MSNTLYNEAIADAKQLKQMAEEDAKNRIIDAITPRIRNLIESKILGESLPEEIEVEDGEEKSEPELDLDLGSPSSEPAPAPAMSHGSEEKPKVKIDPEGPVSVDLGDFEIEFNTSEEDEMVLDQDMAEVLKRATGLTADLSESLDSLEERLGLVKKALGIAKTSGTPSQKQKVSNLVENVAKEAASVVKQLSLANQLGSDNAPERARIDVIIKELKTMTDRKGRNIFDFLFEAEEAVSELSLKEEEEGEAEEGEEAAEAAGEEVSPEVEDAFKSLGDALGLEVEDEGADEGDEDEDEDEDEMDLDETSHMDEMSPKMEMDPKMEMEEVYEIDENVLARELMRLRNLREETSGVEDPSKTADAFGGGDVEDEMFVDVSEEQLLNALDDELGSVSESVKQEIVRRAKRASLRESRARRRNTRRSRRTVDYGAERKIANLQEQLNEMNVFNAKLLYANKLMQNRNLSTKQQRAIVEAMDSAKTVREAKLLYSSLTASMKKGKKGTLAESATKGQILGASSRSTRSASPANSGVGVDRWSILAGLKKDS